MMSNRFLEIMSNGNYIEEKFDHIDTKLDGKFALVDQKLELILNRYVELDAEHKILKKETEAIRVLTRNRSILAFVVMGAISIVSGGGIELLTKLIK